MCIRDSYKGWFYLEQLCYDLERTIKLYADKNIDEGYLSEVDFKFVNKLMKKLNIVHGPINLARLKELNDMYFDKLEFKQEFIGKL